MLNGTPQAKQSPIFHRGETAIQTRVGKRESIEHFAHKAIHTYMPDQHREFFSQLPFLVLGSVDENGWPWASILSGQPGFAHSPDPKTLQINAMPNIADPLSANIKSGAPIGMLGIEVPTRRRNRMNANISATSGAAFTLTVAQAFGNCPQYIQTRDIEFVREPQPAIAPTKLQKLTNLDEAAGSMIRTADTFFVSSYLPFESNETTEGVDVSHRGGKPGFVKIEGNTLSIPDYAGNNLFNTLGNFLLNPKAGLIFPNFETGDVLMLTGTVDILWEDSPEVLAFNGADRIWRFTLDHGFYLQDALPFRARFGDYAPTTLNTSDWQQAETVMAAQAKRDAWRPYRVTQIVDESDVIRSIYLESADGAGLMPFKAGQYLTIRTSLKGGGEPLIRTYTLSSAPGETHYRLSIKREPDGQVSVHLHDTLTVGSVIEAKAPQGDFYIDPSEERPAVLIAAGVGITPMISMAQHIDKEGLRTRHTRSLTIFHAAVSSKTRAFADDFRALCKKTHGEIRYFSFLSEVGDHDKLGVDFNGTERIDSLTLKQYLALDDYDFYLCGPAQFMQAIYDNLLSLGVRDGRIYTEAFGAASLQRTPDIASTTAAPQEEAENAVVKFAKSGFEQAWSKGDAPLLDLAEAHGLTPEYGCRNGVCGSCATTLKAGSVTYRNAPTAEHKADEILICCAIPAKDSELIEIDL